MDNFTKFWLVSADGREIPIGNTMGEVYRHLYGRNFTCAEVAHLEAGGAVDASSDGMFAETWTLQTDE